MLSVLQSMDAAASSSDVWLDLFIKGVAYAIGVQCAIDPWGSLLAKRTAQLEQPHIAARRHTMCGGVHESENK